MKKMALLALVMTSISAPAIAQTRQQQIVPNPIGGVPNRIGGVPNAIGGYGNYGGGGPTTRVVPTASFYVPNGSGDNTPPESGFATADAGNDGGAAPPARNGLTGMVERMQGLGYADGPTASVR